MRSSEIRLRKLKLRLRDKRFANHKTSYTAIWQQPFQSVLALRGCSATDIIYFFISPSQDKIWVRPSLYLTPVVNFGEVRRAQLAKSTLVTSTMVPLRYFQVF